MASEQRCAIKRMYTEHRCDESEGLNQRVDNTTGAVTACQGPIRRGRLHLDTSRGARSRTRLRCADEGVVRVWIRHVFSASWMVCLCGMGVLPNYIRLRGPSRGSRGLGYSCSRPGEQGKGRKDL